VFERDIHSLHGDAAGRTPLAIAEQKYEQAVEQADQDDMDIFDELVDELKDFLQSSTLYDE